jgi:hypothetical protein
MATSELEVLEETESERVLRWRVAELRRAGYVEREAVKLAMCGDVDLHDAAKLLAQGCPSQTALRILL